MLENREYCERIAKELEAYASGNYYKCPECGELIEFDNEQFDENGYYTCQECGKIFEENELEAVSLYDYFDDVLDYEFTCNCRKEFTACKVYVTLGGPTIWIDTASGTVELRWGGESASYFLDYDVIDEINDYFEEIFNNM